VWCRLAKDGWIVPPVEGEPPVGVSKMVNPKEPSVSAAVIVASKDQDEVDNDYFLCPAAIASHDGRLHNVFPLENRLTAQGKPEVREHMRATASQSYVERLTDFHLLLWLSKQPNLDSNDMILLCDAVKEAKPVMEGYRVIIDSIAGI
jgi:nuclear protein localization family protein 4